MSVPSGPPPRLITRLRRWWISPAPSCSLWISAGRRRVGPNGQSVGAIWTFLRALPNHPSAGLAGGAGRPRSGTEADGPCCRRRRFTKADRDDLIADPAPTGGGIDLGRLDLLHGAAGAALMPCRGRRPQRCCSRPRRSTKMPRVAIPTPTAMVPHRPAARCPGSGRRHRAGLPVPSGPRGHRLNDKIEWLSTARPDSRLAARNWRPASISSTRRLTTRRRRTAFSPTSRHTHSPWPAVAGAAQACTLARSHRGRS